MKLLILILFLVPSICLAENFHFVYTMKDGTNLQKFEYKINANTWAEAHEQGADACTKFFAVKKPIDEEYMLEIIDTCANPVRK